MNKQEKNIKDIITFDEIEEIVEVFIDDVYESDKAVVLISDKELIEYTMSELLNDDFTSIKKIDLELDDVEYMILVDRDGDIVVQPIEYYDDKYFKSIECAFVDMDGCVEQATIDNLINRDIPVVLFGYNDELIDQDEYDCSGCDLNECVRCGEINNAEYNKNPNAYTITIKCNLDTKEAEEMISDMESRIMHMNEMFAEMNHFRELFRW